MTKKHDVLRLGGILVAMGVVYGDIGTSPMYVMKAILMGNGGLGTVDTDFILGAVSLVFWTLTLLTTVKYVMIALKADNHGEGGIFALYTLVRKHAKWLLIPTMIGGAALLADGVLTPAVTVTTAIEGLRGVPAFFAAYGNEQNIIIVITLCILLGLFAIQRFGTEIVGKAFGPVMLLWFTFLGLTGIMNFAGDLWVLKALNPYYAVKILFSPDNKDGLFILGSVFLATTGAEALYSDLGHVGRKNIYFSWPYVKVCLVLNYFGQAAWIFNARDNARYLAIDDVNPFFNMLPDSWTAAGVIFATLAAVIASQALITGSYTLVAEAIRLKLLPRLKIIYPTEQKGQLYIPAVNTILWLSCSAIVLYFRTSAHMEAAYGLSITVTMLMTTILLHAYLLEKKVPTILATLMIVFFGGIESIFFISSVSKFTHGGYVAVLIALIILTVMVVWENGNKIETRVSDQVRLEDYLSQLRSLRDDEDVPTYQTNLVFLTSRAIGETIPREIMYSILDKYPKRAKVYWFINIQVTDEPYTNEYAVETYATNYIVNLQLRLGFRMSQDVNVYLRQIIQDLMADGTIGKQPQRYSITPGRQVGDFAFVLIRQELSHNQVLTNWEKFMMTAKLSIKKITTTPARWFGLEFSQVTTEYVPLVIGPTRKKKLRRVEW
ncbi:KUP/HAK/KT family potassium transporter [Enterococcus nangangensis]